MEVWGRWRWILKKEKETALDPNHISYQRSVLPTMVRILVLCKLFCLISHRFIPTVVRNILS